MKSLALALMLVNAAVLPAEEWTIDTSHSSVQFAVRHMMVSTVRGQFGKITGTVQFDAAQPAGARVAAEVDVSTVDTRNAKRDADLKGPDFFDVEKHPKMSFRSTKVEPLGPGKFRMTGELTMRGVTRPVVFEVEGLTATLKDQQGRRKTGATATTRINRSDYGMTWNRMIEAGGVTVSDEVSITIDVELVAAGG